MNDESNQNTDGKVSELEYMLMSGRDRRLQPRIHDRLYQISVGLNLLAWLALVAALVMFHYARPELITGFQSYLGVEVRGYWSEHHVQLLTYLLQGCLLMTLISIGLNQKRSRRQNDRFKINLLVLIGIVLISLLTLHITIQ